MANANGGIDHLNTSDKVARQSSRTMDVQMDHARSHPLFWMMFALPNNNSLFSKWRHQKEEKSTTKKRKATIKKKRIIRRLSTQKRSKPTLKFINLLKKKNRGNFERDHRQHWIAPTIIVRRHRLTQNRAISVELINQCSGYLKSKWICKMMATKKYSDDIASLLRVAFIQEPHWQF